MFFKITQNAQENTCARVSLLIKLWSWDLQLYWKRDSGTDIFLWILRNSLEHLFHRNPPGDCFLKERTENPSKIIYKYQWWSSFWAKLKVSFSNFIKKRNFSWLSFKDYVYLLVISLLKNTCSSTFVRFFH